MSYVLDFQEIDHTHIAVVGGKSAALGDLSRIAGVRVPDGFCVTTRAFQRAITSAYTSYAISIFWTAVRQYDLYTSFWGQAPSGQSALASQIGVPVFTPAAFIS